MFPEATGTAADDQQAAEKEKRALSGKRCADSDIGSAGRSAGRPPERAPRGRRAGARYAVQSPQPVLPFPTWQSVLPFGEGERGPCWSSVPGRVAEKFPGVPSENEQAWGFISGLSEHEARANALNRNRQSVCCLLPCVTA